MPSVKAAANLSALADSCQHSARRIAGDKWDGSALRRINAQHQKQILAERPAATPEVQQ